MTQVSNTRNAASDIPSAFAEFNGELYFSSVNSAVRLKLFKTDGTYVSQVTNINAAGHDQPQNLTAAGSVLYFSANSASGGRKLFKLSFQ